MSKVNKTSIIDEEFVNFIFDSEHNRKVFKKYLRKHFSGLGDKFWSKYYILDSHPSNYYEFSKGLEKDTFIFSFSKQSGSTYTSPIIRLSRNNNVIMISRDFDRMQHYKCDSFSIENIKAMYIEFKRENAIDKLLK